VLVASTPTDKDKQAGTSGHFRICAGAEPTAANRVRPYPHCPSSGARRSPSVDDGGVSSRCMGGCRLWGSGGGAVAVASRHGRGGPVGTATACRLVGVRQRAGAGDWRLGYGPVCFFAGGQGPAARRVRPWGVWALVLLPILPLAGRRRFRGAVLVLIVASGLAGAALAPPPFFWARPSWWRSLRWPPTAASASQWPAWRSPAATRAGSFVPFRWRSGRWAGQAVPQARSSMVRDGRGGNRWRATRAPGQHGARLAE
jgi:hypothetical protein